MGVKHLDAGLDNHWLDCIVGSAVAASMQGAVLFGTDQKKPPRERYTYAEKYAEFQQRKREQGNVTYAGKGPYR